MLEDCRLFFISHRNVNPHVAEEQRRLFELDSALFENIIVFRKICVNVQNEKDDQDKRDHFCFDKNMTVEIVWRT